MTSGGLLRYIRSALQSNPIHALLISASLGALIGLVRQWSYEHEHRGQTAKAGLRTFTAWSLLGCVAGQLEREGVAWALAAILAAFVAILCVFHLNDRRRQSLGLTTLSLGLVTFTAGAMTAYEKYEYATVLGVGAMLILGSKHWSHTWIKRWKPDDVRCLLQFAAITGIILPLAPNQDMGPYQAFNPYQIWLMVVLVASIGFIGYVAMRWLGARAGMIVTGLAGGLTSSTATTLALSRQSRRTPQLESSLALAVVLACTVMVGRVAVMLTIINPAVALATAIPFVLIAVPGVAWALWQWRQRRAASDPQVHTPELANPLSLSLAIKFGGLYALVRFLVKVTAGHLPPAWVYVVSFVSGLTDMDAIAISSAQAALGATISVEVAARCVVIGALSNTLVKAGIALVLGTAGFRRAIAWALGAVFVAGLIGLWLI